MCRVRNCPILIDINKILLIWLERQTDNSKRWKWHVYIRERIDIEWTCALIMHYLHVVLLFSLRVIAQCYKVRPWLEYEQINSKLSANNGYYDWFCWLLFQSNTITRLLCPHQYSRFQSIVLFFGRIKLYIMTNCLIIFI